MMNPYAQQNFFSFIALFFKRLVLFFMGKISVAHLFSDELQVYVLVLIAMSAAAVGVFLIHRKMTMLANALSHTVIFGIVLTYLILKKSFQLLDPSLNFQAMFIASLITGLLTATLSGWISKVSNLQKDASIGLVFTLFFALGILLVTLFSKNGHIGIDMVMGNVDALHQSDLKSMFYQSLFTLLLLTLFFRGLKVSTFDPIFSKLQGFSPSFFNTLMIFMLSLTSIGAFRAVGVVLVLAFFIVPPLFARLFAKSLQGQIGIALLVGMVSALFSVALSRHLLTTYQIALSTGGLTVLVLYGFFFLGSFALQMLKWKTRRTFKNNSLNTQALSVE